MPSFIFVWVMSCDASKAWSLCASQNMSLAVLAGGSDAFGGRSSADQKGAALVHLAVIPPAES